VDSEVVMARWTARFPGVAVTMVEAIGEVVAWSQAQRWRQRRSKMTTAVRQEERDDDGGGGAGQ
jgi:hypothetical protein